MQFQRAVLLTVAGALFPLAALATGGGDYDRPDAPRFECEDAEYLPEGVQESYIVRPWTDGDHAITLKNYDGCSNVDWQFYGDSGRLTIKDDGSATITGYAYVQRTWGNHCQLDVGDAWVLDARLDNLYGCNDGDWACLDFLDGSTFKSTDGERTVHLTQKGPDFQIGSNGANDKDNDFGASGWFYWQDYSCGNSHGDFNFDLDCPTCPEDRTSYRVSDYSEANGAHGIWFKKDLFCDNQAARFSFLEDTSRLEVSADGNTVTIDGYAKVKAGTNCHQGRQYEGTVWRVQAEFDAADPNVTSGKAENGQSQAIMDTWDLFILQNASLTRGHDVIELAKMPVNENYGLQIGDKANGKDHDFGASTWFTWNWERACRGGTGSHYQGDFNIDLELVCEPPENDNDSFLKFDPAAQSILAGENGFNFHLQMGNPGGMPDAPWNYAALVCDANDILDGGISIDVGGINKGAFANASLNEGTGILTISGLDNPVQNGQYFDVNIPADTSGMGTGDYQFPCTLQVPGAPDYDAVFDLNIRTQDNQDGGSVNGAGGNAYIQFNGGSSVNSNANQWYDSLYIDLQYGNESDVTLTGYTIDCTIAGGAKFIQANSHGGFSTNSVSADGLSVHFSGPQSLQNYQGRNLQLVVDELYGNTPGTVECTIDYTAGGAVSESASLTIN